MFKKIALYSLLFLISLMLFLLVTLPANVLWQKMLSQHLPLKQVGVNVKAVDGSIWNGRTHFSYKGADAILHWKVNTLGLIQLELPLDFSLKSTVGEVSGQLVMTPGSATLHVPKADVALQGLNPLLRRERITLSGRALINQLVVSVENNKVIYAEGRGSWTGGDIAYPVGRSVHERNLPPFFANIETQDDGVIHLGVKDADVDFDMIDITVNEQGEALMRVKRRLLDLADEPARHANETDVIFKVKKPLF